MCYNTVGDRMKDYIILTDTRQQKENHILKEFDKQGILHIRTTLKSGDYMALKYNKRRGMFLDYSILIDTKKDLLELAHNLCNVQEHERIKKEVVRAKELGCKNFIFLIQDSKIKTTEDIKKWHSQYTKIRGETLLKIMQTMKQRYNIRFIICRKKDIGSMIIKLLEE